MLRERNHFSSTASEPVQALFEECPSRAVVLLAMRDDGQVSKRKGDRPSVASLLARRRRSLRTRPGRHRTARAPAVRRRSSRARWRDRTHRSRCAPARPPVLPATGRPAGVALGQAHHGQKMQRVRGRGKVVDRSAERGGLLEARAGGSPDRLRSTPALHPRGARVRENVSVCASRSMAAPRNVRPSRQWPRWNQNQNSALASRDARSCAPSRDRRSNRDSQVRMLAVERPRAGPDERTC